MAFIERWLHISPDGGNGASELLILAVVILTIMSVVVVALRANFPRNFLEYVEHLGKRKSGDRFDN